MATTKEKWGRFHYPSFVSYVYGATMRHEWPSRFNIDNPHGVYREFAVFKMPRAKSIKQRFQSENGLTLRPTDAYINVGTSTMDDYQYEFVFILEPVVDKNDPNPARGYWFAYASSQVPDVNFGWALTADYDAVYDGNSKLDWTIEAAATKSVSKMDMGNDNMNKRIASSRYLSLYAPSVVSSARRKQYLAGRASKSPLLRKALGTTVKSIKSKVGDTVDADSLSSDDGYQLMLDSQDIEAVADYISGYLSEMEYEISDITGVIALVGDGDYDEVWVTESSRPFSVSAVYERVY